jgi:hypothetical protein
MSYSFFLDRPGLKDGFMVPLRLRIVDAVGQWAQIGSVLISCITVLGCISILKNILPSSSVLDFLMIFPLFLLFCISLGITIPFVERFYVTLVRLIGLLSKEEVLHLPLRFERGRVDPWPDAWQKPQR